VRARPDTETLTLPSALVAEVKAAADEERRAPAEIVREAIERYLKDRRWRRLIAYGQARPRAGTDGSRSATPYRRSPARAPAGAVGAGGYSRLEHLYLGVGCSPVPRFSFSKLRAVASSAWLHPTRCLTKYTASSGTSSNGRKKRSMRPPPTSQISRDVCTRLEPSMRSWPILTIIECWNAPSPPVRASS